MTNKTNKKILISTWCTDDYAELLGVEKLTNSIKYFHPEVDHIIFDSKMTQQVYEEYPWMQYFWMMAPSCIPFVDDYDMIVHIDADSTVTGPLDELFESEADLIGVRNHNSFNEAGYAPTGSGSTAMLIQHFPPYGDGTTISAQNYINAGLVGSNSKQFWYDWNDLNSQCYNSGSHGKSNEQDTLNQIFHSNKYKSEIIDKIGSGLSYGISNTWGTRSPDNSWSNWMKIYVKNNRLYLDDPVTGDPMCVKVMHQAGGSISERNNREFGGFRNWLSSVVSDEVNDYLEEITNG